MSAPSPSASREPTTAGSALAETDLRQVRRRKSRLELALYRGIERGFAVCGGRRRYQRRHLAPGRFLERHETIALPGLPAALDGFVLAQLSDLHAGAFLGEGDLAHVVARVHELDVDLVALTGDYITHVGTDADALLSDLAGLRARFGCFAVFGNHDYRGRLEGRIAQRFAEVGIRTLRDECARLEVGDAMLALTGLEDLEEAKLIDVERARAALRPGDVEVVLCHNPAGAPRLAREGCALVLSGHTHGGQIVAPFLPRLGPHHPGDRVQHGPTTLVVSRGLGVVGIPLRIGVPAELVVVTLRRGAPEA